MLDAINSPEWEYRYYSFDAGWSQDALVASMRTGSGDDWFIGFCEGGVFIKGFDHECEMTPFAHDPPRLWPGMYDHLPPSLLRFRDEPAFEPEVATYAIWWDRATPGWRTGITTFPDDDDPDGSAAHLEIFGGHARSYVEFAADYYERALALGPVEAIYAHAPLTPSMVVALNPEANAETVIADARALGYGTDWSVWRS